MADVIRQGDVFIILDAAEKTGAEIPRVNGKAVLALGEVTGHAHVIENSACTLSLQDGSIVAPDAMKMLTGGGGYIPDRVLDVKRTVVLRHEEHGPASIPAGKHLVVIDREYAPGQLRNTQD